MCRGWDGGGTASYGQCMCRPYQCRLSAIAAATHALPLRRDSIAHDGMTARTAATIGALLAGLAVAAGAFGAHALRSRLEPRDLEIFETAARYQMYHGIALLIAAWLIDRGIAQAGFAAWGFT